MEPLLGSAARPPPLSPLAEVGIEDKLVHMGCGAQLAARGGTRGMAERTSLRTRQVANAPTTAKTM